MGSDAYRDAWAILTTEAAAPPTNVRCIGVVQAILGEADLLCLEMAHAEAPLCHVENQLLLVQAVLLLQLPYTGASLCSEAARTGTYGCVRVRNNLCPPLLHAPPSYRRTPYHRKLRQPLRVFIGESEAARGTEIILRLPGSGAHFTWGLQGPQRWRWLPGERCFRNGRASALKFS